MGHRAYPGVEIDVREYNGPIYGDDVALINLHTAFTDYMAGEVQYA